MNTGHSLRLALHLLRRDWRAGELTTLAQALIIAVAIVTAITLLADRLKAALWTQSATFLAADRVLEGSTPVPEDWWAQIDSVGVRHSRTVQFISMVFGRERSQFSSVKAVDARYPLRGQLEISSEPFGKTTTVYHGPPPGEVWLESRLIPALDTAIGETLEVGAARLRIGRAIVREPDRTGGFESFGPRVMMNLDDLAETKVIQVGSRVTYRHLFSGDKRSLAQLDDLMKTRVKGSEFRYTNARNNLRGLSRLLNRIERFLLLGGLLGVLLSGVAIALASRRYATCHLDHVALLKSFGATPRDIDKLFTWIMLLLLLATTAAGLLVGGGIQFLILAGLDPWIPAGLPPPGLRPFLTGGLTSGLCLLAFALPSMLCLSNTPPIRIIRRDFDHTGFSLTMQYSFGIIGFIALLLWYSRDPLLTAVILGGTGITLLVFGSLTMGVLGSCRTLGIRAGSTWRFALSSIQLHRQKSVLQILALGLAVMLLLTMTLTRTTLIVDWQKKLPENAPNHFIVNVSPDEKDAIRKKLSEQAVKTNAFYPVVRGRVTRANGVAIRQHVRTSGDRTRPAAGAGSTRNLTWATALPASNEIISGTWWPENYSGKALVSLEKSWAVRNGINIGDRLQFLVQGRDISAHVANIRVLDWNSMQPNFYIIFSPQALAEFSPVYMSSFFLPPEQKQFLNQLLQEWPTATVIEVDAVVRQIQRIMDQGAAAMNPMLLLVLAAAALVLLAGIRLNAEERTRQQAIVRALGASHRLVRRSLILEFCMLGVFSSLLATVGAEISTWALQSQVFGLDYSPSPLLWIIAPVLNTIITGGIGVLAARKLMQIPPALVLRKSG